MTPKGQTGRPSGHGLSHVTETNEDKRQSTGTRYPKDGWLPKRLTKISNDLLIVLPQFPPPPSRPTAHPALRTDPAESRFYKCGYVYFEILCDTCTK